MKNEQSEQIEAYLNHTLTPDQLQAFEQRMAGDAALRQAVELHRALQKDYDTGRLKLRANLQTVMQEPLEEQASPAGKNRWWLWAGLFCLLMIASYGLWQWQTPASVVPIMPPAATPVVPPVETTTAPPATIPDTPKTTRPMAMGNPAHFAPNPGMEAFVNSGVRSEMVTVKMTQPSNGKQYAPDEKGVVQVHFAGSIEWATDYYYNGFVLSFFNNRNTARALLEVPVRVVKTPAGSLTFDMQQRLKFSPGLYYFTVEEPGNGEILYAGKFLIGR